MTIELGAQGPYVRAWQRIVGIRGKAVDGDFGPKTDAKVRAWQVARGVDGDGVIGPLTRAAVLPTDVICPFEGCVLQAYDDERKSPLSARLLHKVGGAWFRADSTPAKPAPCRGVPTIGWGSTAPCRRGVVTCTQAEADAWLAEDLAQTRLPYVHRYAPTGADPAMIAALACFCYNEGTGALMALAGHGFTQAAWYAYDKVRAGGVLVADAGLRMRREEEYALAFAAP